MSKYSLLGGCQPQRGGLSYFCGLSRLLARAATRDGHSDRNCRRGWPRCLFLGVRTPIDHRVSEFLFSSFDPLAPIATSCSSFCSFSLSRRCDINSFSYSRSSSCCDLERRRAVRSIMSMQGFADYVIEGGDGMNLEGRERGGGVGKLPVLATWIHVPVSRSASGGTRTRCSINMRVTCAAWFRALCT